MKKYYRQPGSHVKLNVSRIILWPGSNDLAGLVDDSLKRKQVHNFTLRQEVGVISQQNKSYLYDSLVTVFIVVSKIKDPKYLA